MIEVSIVFCYLNLQNEFTAKRVKSQGKTRNRLKTYLMSYQFCLSVNPSMSFFIPGSLIYFAEKNPGNN